MGPWDRVPSAGSSLSFFLPLGGAGGPKLRSRPAAGPGRRHRGAPKPPGRGPPKPPPGRGPPKPPPRRRGRRTAGPPGPRPARPGTAEAASGSRSAKAAARTRWTARAAIVPRAGFADGQRPAHEELSVELLDRGFGLRALRVFDEGKAARAAGFAVERADDLRRFADLREVRPQVVFCGLVREITNEQSNWWHGTRGRRD